MQVESLRPWSVFLEADLLDRPAGVDVAHERLARNLRIYQTNYAAVTLGFVVLVLLFDLWALAIVGASVTARYVYKNVLKYELDNQALLFSGVVVSGLVLFLTDALQLLCLGLAGGILFSSIHSIMHQPPEDFS